MEVSEIINITRRLTRTNVTSYTDADIFIDLNDAYKKTIARIIQKTTSFDFAGRIAITNIIKADDATQGTSGYNGQYAFPDDILKIVRIEVKSTTGGIFRPLTERDEQQIESAIGDTLSQFYMVFNNTITLSPLPVETVDGGLKIWYEQRKQDLTANNDVPAFEASFHRILALETARSFFINDPTEDNVYRKQQVEGELGEYLARLDTFYATKENKNYQLKVKNVNYGS